MPRCVSYRIKDRPDGLFDVIATIEPDKVFQRVGFTSLAEVDEWVDGLRTLMAAIGAPLTNADALEASLSHSASHPAAGFDEPAQLPEQANRFPDSSSKGSPETEN
jgi:hypothetical protein